MFGVYVYQGVIPYRGVLGEGEFYDMYEASLPTFGANVALSPCCVCSVEISPTRGDFVN